MNHATERVALMIVDHGGMLPANRSRDAMWMGIGLLTAFATMLLVGYMPGHVPLVAVVVLAMASLVVFVVPTRHTRRSSRRSAGAFRKPDVLARLVAYGRVDEIGMLESLEDVPFEPVIIRHVLLGWKIWWVVCLIAVVTMPCCLSAWELPVKYLGPMIPPFIALGVLWLPRWICPIYYRIVPGRMDVMRSPLFRGRMQVVERVDLRSCPVSARFDLAKPVLRLEGTSPIAQEYALREIEEPYRFVQAVFQAAISTHPAPPLPDDALLG